MNLGDIGHGGDPISIQDYVNTYCVPGTKKLGTQISISHITSLALKVLVSTIVRVEGSFTLHLVAWNHMDIQVECLRCVMCD